MPQTARLILLLALALAGPALAHPKPGAHADVRFTIDDHAVTGEFLMNLRFAEQLVRWPRDARDDIAPAEEAPGRAALAQYLGAPPGPEGRLALDRTNRVLIDGVEVAPILAEFRILRPAPETRPGFVDVTQAMLPQVLLRVEYPCKSRPRSVSLTWGAYPRDFLAQDRDLAPISDIDALILAHGETLPIRFREQEPEFTWHAPALAPEDRFRPVPPAAALAPARPITPMVALGGILAGFGVVVVRAPGRRGFALSGLLLAAALGASAWFGAFQTAPDRPELPSRAQASAIFESLHANIYRAFDYTRESEVYDALARSVDGPMLPKVYDDVYRSLIMHEEGGALSRIRSVQPLDSNPEMVEYDAGVAALTVVARWRVEGVVYHWGHSHTRLNEYRARYRVESRPAGWRIVAVEPLEQRRLDPHPESPPAESPPAESPPP